MICILVLCGLDVEGLWLLWYVLFGYWCLVIIDLENGV